MESWSDLPKGGWGFSCVVEVRVTMIQNFASPGHEFDVLIKIKGALFSD
jgi:hypothetical protein